MLTWGSIIISTVTSLSGDAEVSFEISLAASKQHDNFFYCLCFRFFSFKYY